MHFGQDVRITGRANCHLFEGGPVFTASHTAPAGWPCFESERVLFWQQCSRASQMEHALVTTAALVLGAAAAVRSAPRLRPG